MITLIERKNVVIKEAQKEVFRSLLGDYWQCLDGTVPEVGTLLKQPLVEAQEVLPNNVIPPLHPHVKIAQGYWKLAETLAEPWRYLEWRNVNYSGRYRHSLKQPSVSRDCLYRWKV